MFAPLESLAMATVAYTDQFHYPLSAKEVKQRLLSSGALKTLGVKTAAGLLSPTETKIAQTLDRLVRRKKLVKQGEWYGLAGAAATNFKLRRQRARLQGRRKPQLDQLIQALRQVPWIWGVALTGSSAMANAPATADIDVLIVTAPRRLWLTRAVVLLLSWWYRQRGKNGWCFNLWLEPTELALAPEKQGVYEAYELWQCKWLFDRASWRQAWLAQNHWFQGFLPAAAAEGQAKLASSIDGELSEVTPLTRFLNSLEWSGNWLNYALYWLETQYRLARYGEAIPPITQAFFHTPGVRSQIYQKWQRTLAGLGLLS
jgi:hypothetical protein